MAPRDGNVARGRGTAALGRRSARQAQSGHGPQGPPRHPCRHPPQEATRALPGDCPGPQGPPPAVSPLRHPPSPLAVKTRPARPGSPASGPGSPTRSALVRPPGDGKPSGVADGSGDPTPRGGPNCADAAGLAGKGWGIRRSRLSTPRCPGGSGHQRGEPGQPLALSYPKPAPPAPNQHTQMLKGCLGADTCEDERHEPPSKHALGGGGVVPVLDVCGCWGTRVVEEKAGPIPGPLPHVGYWEGRGLR